MRFFLLLLLSTLSLLAMMRDDEGLSEAGVIYVSATYAEPFALPKNSILHVRIEDISQMNVITTTIESAQKSIEGYPPFSLRLDFDTSALKSSRRYGIKVMISHDDTLLFINDHDIDPLKPPFDIRLKAINHNK